MRLKSAGAGNGPNWPEGGRFLGCRREDDRLQTALKRRANGGRWDEVPQVVCPFARRGPDRIPPFPPHELAFKFCVGDLSSETPFPRPVLSRQGRRSSFNIRRVLSDLEATWKLNPLLDPLGTAGAPLSDLNPRCRSVPESSLPGLGLALSTLKHRK
jgi:hypothetical protein